MYSILAGITKHCTVHGRQHILYMSEHQNKKHIKAIVTHKHSPPTLSLKDPIHMTAMIWSKVEISSWVWSVAKWLESVSTVLVTIDEDIWTVRRGQAEWGL